MIVGVGCWRGTGATTTALLLAVALHAEGRRPWLIEADPAGGVLTGRMHLDPPFGGGLERVAFPTDQGSVHERFALAATQVAGVRIVAAPADPFRAFTCHTPRVPWAAALRDLDDPVILDVGTIRADSAVWHVLGHLDVLLLAITTEAVSVVATDEWVTARGRVSPAEQGLGIDCAQLVVVDAPVSGESFSRRVLEADLGGRLVGWLPWSTDAVDLLYRGAAFDDRRLRRNPLVAAGIQLVGRLSESVAEVAS